MQVPGQTHKRFCHPQLHIPVNPNVSRDCWETGQNSSQGHLSWLLGQGMATPSIPRRGTEELEGNSRIQRAQPMGLSLNLQQGQRKQRQMLRAGERSQGVWEGRSLAPLAKRRPLDSVRQIPSWRKKQKKAPRKEGLAPLPHVPCCQGAPENGLFSQHPAVEEIFGLTRTSRHL